MQITKRLLPYLASALAACATTETIPTPTACPPPLPMPNVLTSPVLTGPSLSERVEQLWQDYADSLTKAMRQP